MQAPILVFLTLLLAGAATALQGPTNARLVTAVGSPLNAAFVSFAVGTVALGLLAMILQARPDVGAMKALPWWAWMGGLYGAVYVAVIAYAAPSLGVATALALAIAAQLVAALVIDGAGLLGLASKPLTGTRLLGVLMVIAGVALTRR